MMQLICPTLLKSYHLKTDPPVLFSSFLAPRRRSSIGENDTFNVDSIFIAVDWFPSSADPVDVMNIRFLSVTFGEHE